MWPRHRDVIVPERADRWRADRCLALVFSSWSRTALAHGLRTGLVTDVNGRCYRPSTRVRKGQLLRVRIPGLAPSTPPDFPEILYEDEHLIAINKPPGLVVHPAGSDFLWSVIGLAKIRWPNEQVDLAHRLDRDTSGLLILTKNKMSNQRLKKAFRDGAIKKRYLGICKGEISWNQKEILKKIGPSNGTSESSSGSP